MRVDPRTLVLALLLSASGASAATLVVANKSEATASLVDLGSGEVRVTVATGNGPHEVAVSPDGMLAVVGDYGTRDAPGSSLTVVDVAAGEVVQTVDLGEHRRPHGMRFVGPRKLVVTTEASRSLLLVDIEARKVERVLPTDQEISHMVAVTPDGGRAFVANIGSGTVTALDLRGRSAPVHVATGEGAEGVAVTPDGAQVWVTNRAEDTVTVLDATTLETVATIDSPSFPIRAVATPDGQHVLVTGARSDDVTVFATDPPRLERRIAFDLGDDVVVEDRLFGDRFGSSSVPIGIVVDDSGKRAYVAHANGDVISVVDLESWEVVGLLRAGAEPDGMAVSPLSVATPAPPGPSGT